MKFATIVINISTCKGIEPLKLAFLAQVTYNQPIQHTITTSLKKIKKEKTLHWSFKNCLACKTTIEFNKQQKKQQKPKRFYLAKTKLVAPTKYIVA